MNSDERQQRQEALLLNAFRLRVANAQLRRVFGDPFREITFWEKQDESRRLRDQHGARFGLNEAREWVSSETDRLHGSTKSIKATGAYREALDAYRAAMAAFYTSDLVSAVTRLKEGDRAVIDELLLFLEADPWCFRSGYLKQDLLRYLRHVQLDDQGRACLRDVLIGYVKAGPRMEFREACKTARKVDGPEFRRRLFALRDQPLHGEGVRQRAGWMLDAIIRTNGE